MFHTITFLLFSGLFAFTLWFDRPARGKAPAFAGGRTTMLAFLPLFAFLVAAQNNNGTKLDIHISELRAPLSTVLESRSPRDFTPYIVVGDRPDSADLVVAPYADQNLNSVSMPDQPRHLMVLEARASTADPATPPVLEAQIVARSFAEHPEAEIPGMGISINGRRIDNGRQETVKLVAGGPPVNVTIWRLEAGAKPVLRRSFKVALPSRAGGAATVILNRPLKANAGSCVSPRLRLAPTGAEDAGDIYRDPDNLIFTGLGRGGAYPVAEPGWLGPIADPSVVCAQSKTSLLWPAAADPEAARLVVTAQKIFLPWYVCVFTFFLVVAVHLLCADGWRQPTAERIVVPLLQWLLVLRLLVAVAGLYNEAGPMWDLLWDPLSALLCLPILAVTVLRRGGPDLRPLMVSLAALVALAAAGIVIASGGLHEVRAYIWLCVATAAAALGRCWLTGERSLLESAAVQLENFTGRLVSALRSVFTGLGWLAKTPVNLVAGAVLLAGVVLGLIGLAVSAPGDEGLERISVVPVTLVYVPVVILAFAMMLDGVSAIRARAWTALALTVAFWAAYVVTPLITHDSGMILVFSVPIGLGIAYFGLALLQPAPAGWTRLLWLAPLATAPCLVLALALTASFSEIPDPSKDIGAHIAAVTEWGRNEVRILGFIAPDRVQALGTKFAFEWLDLRAGLGPLTASLWGQGYLTPSNVQASLLENQYWDNVTAIHLIWPLGRLGALGMPIVLLAGMAALAPRRNDDGPASAAWPTMVWFLAGATLLWAAVYMLLANLNWVPFTGRNVYLLAVKSVGDLGEGLILVLTMAAPLATQRPPRLDP